MLPCCRSPYEPQPHYRPAVKHDDGHSHHSTHIVLAPRFRVPFVSDWIATATVASRLTANAIIARSFLVSQLAVANAMLCGATASIKQILCSIKNHTGSLHRRPRFLPLRLVRTRFVAGEEHIGDMSSRNPDLYITPICSLPPPSPTDF